MVNQGLLQELYRNNLGRDPGEAAQGWIGQPWTTVQQGIINSPEYAARQAARARGEDITIAPAIRDASGNIVDADIVNRGVQTGTPLADVPPTGLAGGQPAAETPQGFDYNGFFDNLQNSLNEFYQNQLNMQQQNNQQQNQKIKKKKRMDFYQSNMTQTNPLTSSGYNQQWQNPSMGMYSNYGTPQAPRGLLWSPQSGGSQGLVNNAFGASNLNARM